MGERDMLNDMPDEGSAEIMKRKAIQALMKDKSLTPVERHARMQQIMAGNFEKTTAEELSKAATPSKAAAPPDGAVEGQLPPTENGGSSSTRQLVNAFEQKLKSRETPSPSIYFSTVSSRTRGDGFEEIIRNQGINEKSKTPFISSQIVNSRSNSVKDHFVNSSNWRKKDEHTLETNDASNNFDEVGPSGRKPAHLDEFEERIRMKAKQLKHAKSDSGNIQTLEPALTLGKAVNSSRLTEFEERIRSKSSNSNRLNLLETVEKDNDGINFNSREVNHERPKDPSPQSTTKVSQGDKFDERVRDKLSASIQQEESDESYNLNFDNNYQDLKTNQTSTPATQDEIESEATNKKRQAIKALMQDHSLSSQERSQQMQKIMSGNWEDSMHSSESNSNTNERDLHASGIHSTFMKAALEAKIAAKLRKSVDSQQESIQETAFTAAKNEISTEVDDGLQFNLNTSEEDERRSRDDQNMQTSYAIQNNPDTLVQINDDFNRIEEASPNPGVLLNTPPASGVHFASDQTEVVSSSEDVNPDGLAVATAVAQDDEPEFIYNAIEYDPSSKPPLHRHRRFRVYTFFALLLIIATAVLVSVYVASSTKKDIINEQIISLTESPTDMPTPPPTTVRESSGIREQLEARVLVRNETFEAMEPFDPRRLALDWILHLDEMQLVSDDFNLIQRFALAVMAYTFESMAWYVCGNFTQSECYVYNYQTNSTDIFGVWLSSTPECSWYGVICSSDGIVRGIELINNDLMGPLPYEIGAMTYLQYLSLQGNCIYSTIPSEFGGLRHLQLLELHSNGLSGSMPNEIYDLSSLQLLNLAQQYGVDRTCTRSDGTSVNIYYRFGGLVEPIEENLGLMGELDGRISEMRSLKGLYLFENSFGGSLSPEVGKLRYLTFLRINDNFINGPLPAEITKLGKLRDLRIDDNFMTSSLPVDIGYMEDLEKIIVNGNSMYGPIPESLYNLKKLEDLRLHDTLMVDEPWLPISEEGFTGSISSRIGDLKNLQFLTLHNNPLTGTIPSELGSCDKLEIIRVHKTNITGEMPVEVCLLRDKSLNNEQGFGALYADCRPNNRTGAPYLQCSCCTDCCDHTTKVCVADD